jgi:hypothetical protein
MAQPSSSRELGPVSPSLLARLACPLRVAFEQASIGGDAPASDAATLGTVAHRAIQLTLDEHLLDEAWLQACSEEQTRSGTDPTTLPAARRTLLRLKKHVPRLVDLLERLPYPRRLSETWFETADGALGGKPDLVAIGDDAALVIDYKTGLVTSDEGVESTYVRQLLFYGALVQECLHAVPAMLALLSLREGVVEVQPTPEATAAVAAESRESRSEFNRRAPGSQPANPSQENCRWCGHASECGPFWEAVEPHWQSVVGGVVRGNVDAEPEHATSGVTTLQVAVDAGPHAGARAILTGIPTELVARASIGSTVSLLDLRTRSEDPLVLTWTNRASALLRIAVQ